jgi:enoyl-CoA hydratase/carnithine racemase
LASVGKSFCAGADFSGTADKPEVFYGQAMRLFEYEKPIVAAVHGAAIGGGVGLALVADFRVACPSARFSVNFNRLGIHPGFGLTVTLPRLIGMQRASLLFYTGRRIDGNEAFAMNLVDELVAEDAVLRRAQELAGEIAASAPLAVQSTRHSLRLNLAAEIRAMNRREQAEQMIQQGTMDFKEGVRAMAERRLPVFAGR